MDIGISSLTFGSPLIRLGLVRLLQTGLMAGILFLHPQGTASLGLTGPQLGQGIRTGMLWSAILGIGAAVTAGLIFSAGQNPFTLPGPASPSGASFFIIACVLSPIAEELFFRGILYSYLRRFIGILPAVLLSSLVFAACHPSFSSLPLIPFMGGLVFAAAFEHSKSLAAPFIIHILGNTALLMGLFSLF
jgi:hypothetical protein